MCFKFFSSAVRCYEEYKAVVLSKGRGVKEKQKRWRPPGDGVLKLNTYGVFVPNNRVSDAGVIISNNKGEVTVIKIILLFGVTSPKYVKILAISYGYNLN